MKTKLLVFVTVLVMVFTILPFALACDSEDKAPNALVYLFEKTPITGDGAWPLVLDGAKGTLEYNLWGPKFKFEFNGKGLLPKTSYTLVYYPDPWPGTGLICLGTDTSNKKGRVEIEGKVVIGENLPISTDANAVVHPLGGLTGAKIWLVLSSDVDCTTEQMIGWNPTEYLFETAAIVYVYTAPPLP
jgi:hypothetical protein